MNRSILFRRTRAVVLGALFLGLSYFLSGPAAWSQAPALEVLSNLPYKETGDAYEMERCKLDLYRPAGSSGLPCLIWLHGGGMTAGSKDGKTTVAVCRALASEGMLVAAVNYRLSPKATYPAYIDDAAAATAWLLKHAAEYGADPGKLFVAGHSAGGYLTAMLTVDGRYLEKYGTSPGALAGVIPLSGQMATHYTIREERGLPKTQIIIDDAAPLHHARKDTPPMLILYAEHDMTLRADENRYFAAALTAAGNHNFVLREMAGFDHGGIGDRIAEAQNPVREAIANFMGLKKPDAIKTH